METKTLKPTGDAKIRDPQTKEYLPEEGRLVEMTSYWNRRIQDGTVMIVPDQNAILKSEKPQKKGSDA
ncbi:MAG: hypothetical protein A3I05_01105 [Deltaproteobacteria bacterium RIFCSPLOWO2_02_FULL_44_10]|nr:MAG: hypothetical protein A3C46_02165 [Deltaproteobacteria bacterium RIFCSPHIGHO2_02_FULL_44_16]OGQ45841.1 MAG: hypothetical protein A3I05_01105 [Deltaproteobacteria bacterium RIFCSPLOWO2_02_FULL_44_10]